MVSFTKRKHLAKVNGFAQNRPQAITWTKAYLVHRRMNAALGGDELIDRTLAFKASSGIACIYIHKRLSSLWLYTQPAVSYQCFSIPIKIWFLE